MSQTNLLGFVAVAASALISVVCFNSIADLINEINLSTGGSQVAMAIVKEESQPGNRSIEISIDSRLFGSRCSPPYWPDR